MEREATDDEPEDEPEDPPVATGYKKVAYDGRNFETVETGDRL